MNKQQVLNQLKEKYPGRNIIALPENAPTEILCEVDPTSEHKEYSVAISVIDRSVPHLHHKTTETYKVIRGAVALIIDGIEHQLKKGDSFVIKPGSIHFAVGNEAWIECRSEPGWTPEDHIILKEITPNDSRYVPLTQQKWCCVPTCIQMVMLRHNIPLQPAELIGYYMGLTVPSEALRYFYNSRTGPRPSAGYGTQVGEREYGPNRVFKELGIPLKMSWSLINRFKTLMSFKNYLMTVKEKDQDVLVCFDWPTLFDDQSNDHWGHVCVLDKVFAYNDTVRFIDPETNSAKWVTVSISELYRAMKFHGEHNSGGFWELKLVR